MSYYDVGHDRAAALRHQHDNASHALASNGLQRREDLMLFAALFNAFCFHALSWVIDT